jgi:DNA-directed RNA polymerase specialized sigma24 family protein
LIHTTSHINHLDPHTLNLLVDGELPLGEQQRIQRHLKSCSLCALYALSVTELKAATARAVLLFDPCTTGTTKANHALNDTFVNFDSQPELRAAIRQLQPILREALLLCDVQELSYEEIAIILDIPISTVMSRISDARDTLYDLLILQLRNPNDATHRPFRLSYTQRPH